MNIQKLLLTFICFFCAIFLYTSPLFPLNLPSSTQLLKGGSSVPKDYIIFKQSNPHTQEDLWMIFGKVDKDVKFLFLADKEIKFDKDRNFTIPVKLTIGENSFLLKAFLKNGKMVTKTFKVNRSLPPSESSTPVVSDVQETEIPITQNSLDRQNSISKISSASITVPVKKSAVTQPKLNSKLVLISPNKDYVSQKDTIFFKGYLDYGSKLLINDQQIRLKKKNARRSSFSYKQQITSNIENIFVIHAIFKDQRTQTIQRKVIYLPPQNLVSDNKVVSENLLVTENISLPLAESLIPSDTTKLQFQNSEVSSSVDVEKIFPQLVLITPTENSISIKNFILFKGVVSHTDTVFINDTSVPIFKNGQFSYKASLVYPNQNQLFIVKAISQFGEAVVSVNVYYKLLLKPLIHIVIPEKTKIVTKTPDFSIQGFLENADELYINQEPIAFDENGRFMYRVFLTKSEPFIIKAKSKDNLYTLQRIDVTYIAPVLPKLFISEPVPTSDFVTTHDYVYITGKAIYTNQLLLNGETIPLSKLKAQQSKIQGQRFSVKVKLMKPNTYHLITLVAKSDDGVVTENIRIYYKVKVKPELDILDPKMAIIKMKPGIVTIEGTVRNSPRVFLNQQPILVNQLGQFSQEIIVNQSMNLLFSAKSIDDVVVTKSIFIKVIPYRIPSFKILKPTSPQNYITTNDLVVIEGQVSQADMVLLNGEPIVLVKNKDQKAEDGVRTFSAKVKLTKPNSYHDIILVGKSDDGVVTENIRIYYQVKVKPELEIQNPKTNFLKMKPGSVTIEGIAKNSIQTFLNQQELVLNSVGQFSQSIEATRSMNLVISAQSVDHVVVSKNIHIEVVPVRVPSLMVIEPNPTGNYITSNDLVYITGKVKNVDRLLLNGEPLEINQARFATKVKLTHGNSYHYITLVGKSDDGVVTENLRIYYKVKVKPELEILNPKTGMIKMKSGPIMIEGIAKNVTQVLLNQQPIDLHKTGEFSEKIVVTQSMDLMFLAKSTDGSILTKNIHIEIIPERILSLMILEPKPTYNYITTNDLVYIAGRVQNVDTLLLNGEPISIAVTKGKPTEDGFGKFTAKVKLTKANSYHDLTLVGKSEEGVITENLRIYYKVKVKPELEIQNPKTDMIKMKQGTLTIEGIAKNSIQTLLNQQELVLNSAGQFSQAIDVTRSMDLVLLAQSADHVVVSKNIHIEVVPIRIPSLMILEPKPIHNYITTNELVYIVGRIKNIDTLLLNGAPVTIPVTKEKPTEEGIQFTAKIKLTKANSYHDITLVGKSDDGVITENLRIYYKVKVKPELDMITPKTDLIKMRPGRITLEGIAKNVIQVLLNQQELVLNSAGQFSQDIEATRSMDLMISAKSIDNIIITKNIRLLVTPWRIPSLTLTQPKQIGQEIYTTLQNQVTVSGKAENTDTLILNDKPVQLKKDGRFSAKISLPKPNAHYVISLKAQSNDGVVTKDIHIFYKVNLKPDLKFRMVDAETGADLLPPEAMKESEVGIIKTQQAVVNIEGFSLHTDQMTINDQPIDIHQDGSFLYSTLVTKSMTLKILVKSPDQVVITKNISIIYIPQDTEKATVKEVAKETVAKEPVKPKPKEKESSKKSTVKSEEDFQLDYEPLTVKATVPMLYLAAPLHQEIFTDSFVTFRGIAQGLQELFINEKKITLTKNGEFMAEMPLTAVGKYTFKIHGVDRHNRIISITRTIFKAEQNSTLEEQQRTDQDQKHDDFFERMNKKISLELSNADIKTVLRLLAKKGNLNIVSDKSLAGVLDISLKEVPLKTAIDLVLNSQGLSYEFVGNTIVVADSAKLRTPTLLKTTIIKLNNISSSDASKILQSHIVEPEKIQAVDADNLLIIQAGLQHIDELVAIAKRIDSQRVPQILLEARILETSTSALKGLGIAWPQNVGIGADIYSSAGKTTVQSNTSVAAILNFLEESGQGKILARPNIKAIHQQEASIFIGDKIPYTETTIDGTGKLSESVKFVDSGIKLIVKPMINVQEKMITIKIEPEVSFIYGWRGKNNNIPWVKTRKVSTMVSLKDGETVIIGGLFNSSDTDNTSRVPVLGDLPIVGNLFNNNKVDKTETQLIITVTPKIIFDELPTENVH